jgi:hypothetical protein
MQFIERGLDWLQKNILNRLYNHSFSSISNVPFDLQCACLTSCAWLFAHLIILWFCLTSDIFLFALCTKFDLPHPLTFRVTHCIYDQPWDSTWIYFFCCFHDEERTRSHDVIQNIFTSICEKCKVNKPMSFHHLPFNFFDNGLTLCYKLMAFTPWLTWSSIITNLILIDLVFWTTSCHGMAATMASQAKKDFTMISTQQTHFFSLL